MGACWPLGPADVITSTHRGHGHCLAKGLDPLGMFAELMARDQGTNRGRGGSMHIADPTLGIFGANGIVAAGLPIAVGAATAAQLRADGSVAVAFFGDGAVAQGAFHEAVNLAAVWALPVVFFCENNGYAEFSAAADQHGAPLERRAAGYGVGYVAVDGNDVVATASAMQDVVEALRGGAGPTIVEAATYRWHGHYEGDPERYRTPEEKRGLGGTRPARRPRRCAPRRRRRRRRHRRAGVDGGRGAGRGRRRGPSPGRPGPGDAVRLRAPAATVASRASEPRRRCAGVPHDGRDPRRARSRARRGRRCVPGGHRRRCRRQRLRAHPGPPRPVRGPRARHADLGDGGHGPRRRRGDGGHAAGGGAHVPRLRRASASISCSTRPRRCRS